MRVGVVILPQFSWPEARARWMSLEEHGFAHGWTYDHLAWRSLADEPWYATIPTLVAAATATTTLRLGTWVASPHFRHPVTFAKDLMTLDDVAGGRIVAADGWATTGPASGDSWWSRLADLVRRFEDAAAELGRDPGSLLRMLSIDAAPVPAITSFGAFTDAAGRAVELGFTDAVLHWPRPTAPHAGDDALLDDIAGTLVDGEWRG